MRIALVHEFLNQLGGAERVLENFLEIWPDADLYVILYDKEKTQGVFEKYSKKISWLDKFPLAHKHHRLLLNLMPAAVESFDFTHYDVILSDSSSFAKGVRSNGTLHICYCHTPTRFLWTEKGYLGNQKYPKFFRWLGAMSLGWLRRWDYKAAQRPNFMIANSRNVQSRINKFYKRDSKIIYPPVDTEFFKPNGGPQDYFLVATRLEPYKKVEIVIHAFNELNLPLKIVGHGTIAEDLKNIAGPNIQFLGRVSDEELRKLYSGAKAYIFPAEEDAGISMLEAQSCGTPVISYKAGGALELIEEHVSGEYFIEQTADSLKLAVQNFRRESYQPAAVRDFALKFDKRIFQKKIKDFVEHQYQL